MRRIFRDPTPRRAGPSDAELAAAVARIGQDALEVAEDRIRLARPAMSVTLNGIGEGYVTDRVVDLLRAGGVEHAMVNMGEIYALGGHPAGGPWSVGLEDPRAPSTDRPNGSRSQDRAVATSAGYGTTFDAAGRFNHLFEPRTGPYELALAFGFGRGRDGDRSGRSFDRLQRDAGGSDRANRSQAWTSSPISFVPMARGWCSGPNGPAVEARQLGSDVSGDGRTWATRDKSMFDCDSADDLLAVAEALEHEAAARYRSLAARMARQGDAELAAQFDALAGMEDRHAEPDRRPRFGAAWP